MRGAPTLIRRLTAAWLLVLFFIATGCHSQTAAPQPLGPASTESLRRSIEYLSSDALEGRGPGTAGIDSAANYIASYFEGLGLKPPTKSGYFQPFKYTTVTGVDPKTRLASGEKSWKAGEEFNPLSISAEKEFSGSIAFVGYGIAAKKDRDGKDINYDDYAGIDVKGKVALALRFEPVDSTGKSRLTNDGWSENAAIANKAKLAAQHGAAALLIVHPPLHHGLEILSGAGRQLGESISSIPVLQIKQHVAEQLLTTAGAGDLKSFQSAIIDTFIPRSSLLAKVQVSGDVALHRNIYDLKNVTAGLPCKGKHAQEKNLVGPP